MKVIKLGKALSSSFHIPPLFIFVPFNIEVVEDSLPFYNGYSVTPELIKYELVSYNGIINETASNIFEIAALFL